MNEEEKDFFERCFGIVAGLEVGNEAQAIAKEVVLDEIENLQSQLEQKEDNWNKLKEWLKEQDIFITELPAFTKEISIEHKIMSNCYEDTLDKMQEIEGGMNE